MVAPGTADYLLAFVTLGIGTVIVGICAAILIFYAAYRWKAHPEDGLVVWHVIAISTAGAGVWVIIGATQLDRVGLLEVPVTVRLAMTIADGLLWIAALLIIARQSRRRLADASTSKWDASGALAVVAHDDDTR